MGLNGKVSLRAYELNIFQTGLMQGSINAREGDRRTQRVLRLSVEGDLLPYLVQHHLFTGACQEGQSSLNLIFHNASRLDLHLIGQRAQMLCVHSIAHGL